MDVTIEGTRIYCQPVGPEENYPLIALHGGPGLDHTELHPWLDDLADTFRLIYVDQRGQGRSERVDSSTLSIQRFSRDITLLAEALGLGSYAVLGHSFGSLVSLVHAIEEKDASHYILSGCSASMTKSMAEVHANLAAFEPVELREQVTESWAMEPTVQTEEEAATLMGMQMPFHFKTADSDAYRRYIEYTSGREILSPSVLAYFASNGYELEVEDRLAEIDRPALVVTGEFDRTTTPRAAQDLAAGIAGSRLLIIPDAGHMTHVEQPHVFCQAVREFFLQSR